MEEIIIATSNKGKVREAQEILKKFKVIPMSEIGVNIDVEEDEKTFKENAIKKAQIIAQEINKRCLADDSGIEIEYLNGFPGVITKRWHSGTDRERNIALLEKLIGVPKEKRKIKFITAIALSDGNTTICKEGIIEGAGESGRRESQRDGTEVPQEFFRIRRLSGKYEPDEEHGRNFQCAEYASGHRRPDERH